MGLGNNSPLGNEGWGSVIIDCLCPFVRMIGQHPAVAHWRCLESNGGFYRGLAPETLRGGQRRFAAVFACSALLNRESGFTLEFEVAVGALVAWLRP